MQNIDRFFFLFLIILNILPKKWLVDSYINKKLEALYEKSDTLKEEYRKFSIEGNYYITSYLTALIFIIYNIRYIMLGRIRMMIGVILSIIYFIILNYLLNRVSEWSEEKENEFLNKLKKKLISISPILIIWGIIEIINIL